MKIASVFLFLFILLSLSSCDKYESYLTQAKHYEVIDEHEITLNNQSRSARMWFIVSEATTFDEYAQTAIKAALDQKKNNKKIDLIGIILVPDRDLAKSGICYATVFYAVDKKGLESVSGADQNTMADFEWLVKSAENPLDDQELKIACLWYRHQQDFPSEEVWSSLSYNRDKLVNFIADSLNLEQEDVKLPHTTLIEYTDLNFLD